jgi:hypothetical protein
MREGNLATAECEWQQTLGGAGRLPADLLHERVDGEWSFIETLRHPFDLPPTGMKNPSLPRDLEARPSLDEVVVLRDRER